MELLSIIAVLFSSTDDHWLHAICIFLDLSAKAVMPVHGQLALVTAIKFLFRNLAESQALQVEPAAFGTFSVFTLYLWFTIWKYIFLTFTYFITPSMTKIIYILLGKSAIGIWKAELANIFIIIFSVRSSTNGRPSRKHVKWWIVV